MSERGSQRRAIVRRPSRGPLIGVTAAAVALLGASLAPALVVPHQVASASQSTISRVCPTLDAGVQTGVATAAEGLTQSALTTPATTQAVASGTVFAVAKDPVRLSAPVSTAFWGFVAASAPSGVDQGLSLAPCRPARTEAWIPGVRSNTNARADLVLINPDAGEAAVNVSVFGSDGPLAVAGARGVVVPARSQKVVPLSAVIDSPGAVTLQVATSSGRVAAFVRQRLFDGVTPLGADWIVPGEGPSTTVVLPSVPSGAGARTLIVTNPTDRTAQVKAEVLGSEGTYDMVGVGQVDIPAQSTKEFPLDKGLNGAAAALRLTASKEIVAAIEARTAGDWATMTGAPGLGSSAMATIALPTEIAPTVTLANPTAEVVHVEITVTNAAGAELLKRAADIPASGSVQVLPGMTGVAHIRVTSGDPAVRLGVAAAGNVGTVPALASLVIADAAVAAPAIAVTPDAHLG